MGSSETLRFGDVHVSDGNHELLHHKPSQHWQLVSEVCVCGSI